MKQMIKDIFRKLLLLLLFVSIGVGEAWGASETRTWEAKTAVASGKGTANAYIYTYNLNAEDTEDNHKSTLGSTLVTATKSETHSDYWVGLIKFEASIQFLTYRYCKFSATASTGYTFAGWYATKTASNSTSTSTPYKPQNASNSGMSYTYYAKFTPNTYTISFNANGGTGSMSRVSCTYDVNTTLPSNTFTRTGYTFSGWNTKKNGTGTSYTNGATIKNLTATDGETVTLYAQWTANKYDVTFDENYTEGSTTTIEQTYDSKYSLPTPTRDGYNFVGWFTSSTAEQGTQITTSTTVKITDDQTLYAHWKPVFNFSVSADIVSVSNSSWGNPNAGITSQVVGGETDASSTQTATFTANTAENCTFEGWYSTADIDPENDTPVSTATTYTQSLTNSTPGSTESLTLYAYYKHNQTLSWVDPDLDTDEPLVVGKSIGENQVNTAAISSEGQTVTYTSSNSTALSVDADGNLTPLKEVIGTVTIAATAGNDSYNTVSITREFIVKEKKTPVFDPASGTTFDKKVDDDITITLDKVSDGLDGDFKVSASTDNVVSWSRFGNTLTVHCDHASSTTLTLTQTENDDIFAATATYTINVTRYENTLSMTIPNSYYVGETKDVTFTDNNSDADIEVKIKGTIDTGQRNPDTNYQDSVISYADGKITAWNKGTATITFTQPQNNKYDGFTTTVNVTVEKIANTLNPTITATSLLVEGTAAITMEGENNDVTDNPISVVISNQSTPTHPNPSDGTNIITYSNGVITAQNAGTAKITISQVEDYKYYAATTKEFNITVEKHSNTIKVNNTATSYSTSLNYASTKNISITRDNQNSVPTVSASSDSTIATYAGTGESGTLTTYFTQGTAIFSVSQAEDYKYQAGSATITVTVSKLTPSTCYLINESSEHTLNGSSCTCSWNNEIEGVAGTLTFEGRRSSTGYGSISVDGEKSDGTWNKNVYSISGNALSGDLDDSYNSYSKVLTPSLMGLRFSDDGYLAKYVKNIKVTRKTFLRTTESSLNFGTTLESQTVARQFYVEWSSSNTGDILLSCDNPHFTVSPDRITNTDCASGRTLVIVTYLADEHPTTGDITHSGTITIYDKGRVKTVNVIGTTQPKYNLVVSGQNQSIQVEDNLALSDLITYNYEGNDVVPVVPQYVATADEHTQQFYFTIAIDEISDIRTGCPANTDEVVVTYNSVNHQFHACNAGKVTVTFVQLEDNGTPADGSPAVNAGMQVNGEHVTSVSYTITVTKHEPKFVWNYGKNNQNLGIYFNHNTTNEPANPYEDYIKGSQNYNDGCTLTVTSSDETVATISLASADAHEADLSTYNNYTYNPTYSAQSTDVTIAQAENYYWNYASETKTVTPSFASNHVEFTINSSTIYNALNPSTNGTIYYDGGTNIRFNENSWTKNENWVIITFTGIPDKLKFSTSTSTYSGFSPANGDHNFYIYESSDGASWQSVWENTDDLSTSNNEVQLQPTTRQLKFRYYGRRYGYYENITVTELHQFYANPDEMNFGLVNSEHAPRELVQFVHANAGYKVQVEGSEHFTVEPLILPNTGGERMGIEYLAITFHPVSNVSTTYNEDIHITDEIGNTETIHVLGEATTLSVPEFTWNPLERPYYCSPSDQPDSTYYIPNVFSSTNTNPTATITYTSSDESIAKVVDGYLYIYTKDNQTPQEVTITVTQAGIDNEWIPRTESYTFKPRVKPDLSVPFVMTEEVYNMAYTGYSQLWELKNFTWKEKTDVYRWDASSGIKLGGDNTTAWADATAFTHPYLPAMTWDDKYIIFEFDGEPDSLSFQYRTNLWSATSAEWSVEVRSSEPTSRDKNWTVVWRDEDRGSSDWSEKVSVALPHNARFVKLCYSGNFAGYFKDVTITAFDGTYFLQAPNNGPYVSRLSTTSSHRAVTDDYGIAFNKTRVSNDDNSMINTRFQYVDNGQFLSRIVENNEVVSNTTQYLRFDEQEQDDGTIILGNPMNSTTRKYVTINTDSTLSMITDKDNATRWTLVRPNLHQKAMDDLNDAQVRSATTEFGEEIASLGKLRGMIYNEDYEKVTAFTSTTSYAQQFQQSNGKADVMNGTVTDLEEGLYCLNVKGFYRIGANIRGIKAHLGGYDCPTAYVYVKDVNSDNYAKTRMCSVYDYAQNSDCGTPVNPDFSYVYGVDTTAYYPNNETSAEHSFNIQYVYDNDVYIYVHEDAGTGKGAVQYGIKAPSNANDSNWLSYKQVTLTRLFRKEFIFDNHEGDHLWTNGQNWRYDDTRGEVPQIVHKTRIEAPAVIPDDSSEDAEQGVFSLNIIQENGKNGSVTISPKASLTVREGGIKGATTGNLILQANEHGQTGALRLYPGIEAPYATVQFYSIINNDPNASTWAWQYIGSPITQTTIDYNERVFYNCWLYEHDTQTDTWDNAGNWNKMEPFRGYAFTRNDGNPGTNGSRGSTGPLFGYYGQLNPASTKVLNLKYKDDKRENHFANSWTAPIKISLLKANDFYHTEPVIYYYAIGEDNATSIAPFTSEYTGPDTLASMQGFFVLAEKENPDDAKLILDYERIIWASDVTENSPLKTPSRERQQELTARICVQMLSADSIRDRVYLLEKEDIGFSRAYEIGYDAPKYIIDGLPCIYTYEPHGTHLAVSATDSILGTYLAINTNASQTYTIYFDKVIGEDMGLHDLVTDMIVPIRDGEQYTFTATPNTTNQLRFVVEEYIAPEENQGGTDIEGLDGSIQIWQTGDILSVTGAGRNAQLKLFDATGKLIVNEQFHVATTYNLAALPNGVYVVTVGNVMEKVLH